jgi:membrane protein implicated in regulation of membrane protease activity
MDQNRPSIPEVLADIGGLGFVLGTVMMAAFPFAVPALIFGLLLLPLLLPVLLLAGLYVLVRRLIAAIRRPRAGSERRGSRRRRRDPRPSEAYARVSEPSPSG